MLRMARAKSCRGSSLTLAKNFMKLPRILLLSAALAAAIVLSRSIYAEPSGEKIPPQRFEAVVIKTYTAKDGEATFRAYAVRWKDQEVIASDPLAHSDYHEGDTITVLAMNHPFPQGKEPRRLLGFTVVPKGR